LLPHQACFARKRGAEHHGRPYHSWAASHATHRRHTNDIVGGESWVPDVLPADGKLDLLQRFMAVRFGGFFRVLSVFHAYLLVNMTGDLRNMGQSHFVAAPRLFKRSMRGVFRLNNAALALVFGSVLRAVLQHGFGTTSWLHLLLLLLPLLLHLLLLLLLECDVRRLEHARHALQPLDVEHLARHMELHALAAALAAAAATAATATAALAQPGPPRLALRQPRPR
jgi:hypothetical protein